MHRAGTEDTYTLLLHACLKVSDECVFCAVQRGVTERRQGQWQPLEILFQPMFWLHIQLFAAPAQINNQLDLSMAVAKTWELLMYYLVSFYPPFHTTFVQSESSHHFWWTCWESRPFAFHKSLWNPLKLHRPFNDSVPLQNALTQWIHPPPSPSPPSLCPPSPSSPLVSSSKAALCCADAKLVSKRKHTVLTANRGGRRRRA